MLTLRMVLLTAFCVLTTTSITAAAPPPVQPVIPEFLPIGKRFPGKDLTVYAYFVEKNALWNKIAYKATNSARSGESLELTVNNTLKELADAFEAPAWKLTSRYFFDIWVEADYHRTAFDGHFIANQRLPGFPFTGTISLTEDGKIPSESWSNKVHLKYEDYIPLYIPGLKGVLVVTRQNGEDVVREESENGITEKVYPLYPGREDWEGPDILQLHTELVVFKNLWPLVEGEVTVYLSEDRKIFGTYDLDGEKLASSEPDSPIRLQLTPLKSLELFGSRKPPVEVRVTGPPGAKVSVEYTDNLSSAWKLLKTLELATDGSAMYFNVQTPVTNGFYRARRPSGDP